MARATSAFGRHIKLLGRAVVDRASATFVEVTVRAEIERARIELRLGDIEKCERSLATAQEKVGVPPGIPVLDAVLLSVSGQAARARGANVRAEQLFGEATRRFAALAPQELNKRDHGDFGIALAAVGEAKRARAELKLAIQGETAPPEVMRELAKSYLDQQKPAKAGPLIQLALAAMPGDPDLHCLQARVLRAQGRDDDARLQFEQAGRLFLHAGRPGEAVAALSTAIEADPAMTTSIALRGEARRRLGEPAAALVDFDRALSIEPQDPVVLAQRAATLALLGDLERARTDIGLALRQAPDEPEVLVAAAEIAQTAHDLDRADHYAKRVLRHDPTSPRALEIVAAVSYEMGNVSAAHALTLRAGPYGGGRTSLLRLRWQLALLDGDREDALTVLAYMYDHGVAETSDIYKYASMRADDDDWTGALSIIRRGRQEWPQDFYLELLEGEVLLNGGQCVAALELSRSLLTRYPEQASAHLLLAVALVCADQPWPPETAAEALQAAARSADLAPDWAEPWWIRAFVLDATGDAPGALAAVEEVIRRDWRHRDARRLATRIHLADNDLDKAERSASELIKQDPSYGDGAVDLARVLARRGQLTEALEVVNRPELEWLSNASRVDHLLLRADLRRSLTMISEAQDDLAQASALAPNRTEVLIEQSITARLAGEVEAARDFADRAAELAPNDLDVMLEQARSWYWLDPAAGVAKLADIDTRWAADPRVNLLRAEMLAVDDPRAAADVLADLAARHPDSIAVVLGKARLELDLGDVEAARESIEAITDWHKNADLLALHAETCRLSGNPAEAITETQACLDIFPSHYEGLASRGLAHLDAGEAKLAAEDFERALMIYRNDPLAKARLGDALSVPEIDEFDRAIALLDDAAASAPTTAWVVAHLGDVLTTIGVFDAAAQVYRMAIEASPESAEAHHGLGWCLMHTDPPDLPAARAACERAADLNDGLWSRKNLADVQHLQGDTHKAVQLYSEVQTEALAQLSRSAEYFSLAAWCAYQLGNLDAAARWLYESTSGQVNTGSDHFDLALVHVCAGRIQRGIRAYEALLPPPACHPQRARGLLLVARNDLREARTRYGELTDNVEVDRILQRMDYAVAKVPAPPPIATLGHLTG
ncbi:MAG TPA: tetratricopeptide repeat protein [Jatrophihabitans sp.]|jgi:tetratricopeptide (TPR) repeat protein|uniref:tetratricopeptide repeat protein n=1 Tax=Jatrophihabitans sp. TaxID=1932789 RepID=UPI002EFCDD5B